MSKTRCPKCQGLKVNPVWIPDLDTTIAGAHVGSFIPCILCGGKGQVDPKRLAEFSDEAVQRLQDLQAATTKS